MNIIKNNKKYTILIGITAGIAAYKILDLIKLLRKYDHDVYVIMTDSASKMIHPGEFVKSSRHPVYTSLFKEDFDYQTVLDKEEVEHIRLADSADIFVIAPATANLIAKIANGIADNYLTTTLLAVTCPVLICPSMNLNMWFHPAVQKNLAVLKNLGYRIFSPDKGRLACGYNGIGRLKEPKEIKKEIFYILEKSNKLAGKRIMVTAGGTSEAIDAVRVITNRASGKMGMAIAGEVFYQGADVLLLRSITALNSNLRLDTSEVAGISGLPRGGGIKKDIRSFNLQNFESGQGLSDLIKKHVKNFDVIFHTAAVSDYKPVIEFGGKLDSTETLTLHLETTVKILSQIKKWNPKILLVGFKAVYRLSEKKLIRAGMQKLKVSNSDFLVVNDVGKRGIGFGADDNEVYIIGKKGYLGKIEKSPKAEIARKLLDYIF